MMNWSDSDVRANREYFERKLNAIKQRQDVWDATRGERQWDFVLLDVRPREAFKSGHIEGAWCAPLDELDTLMERLPRDAELVTYCWGHD
jgi:rhodanese-related sulfurtransferase